MEEFVGEAEEVISRELYVVASEQEFGRRDGLTSAGFACLSVPGKIRQDCPDQRTHDESTKQLYRNHYATSP
jgi:hypothetical protein